MNREETLALVNKWTSNKNLVKHMLAVEAQMRAIYRELKKRGREDESTALTEDDWGVLGLIHDADYDKWPAEHPKKTIAFLEEAKGPQWLIHAVWAHAWKFNGIDIKPENLLEWSIYTCDELSGFIIACALVKSDKSLASVTVETVLKKWPQKAFAAGVHRSQVELCESTLGIPLKEYMAICLVALQSISQDLGL